MNMKKIILLLVILALFLGCVEDNSAPVQEQDTSLKLVFDQNANQVSSNDANLYKSAISKRNFSDCNLISDSFVKSKCFFDSARDTNNRELCKSVEVPALRINCERIFLDINK